MNLPGDPFAIILAVLFFVVPLLGRVLGRLRRGQNPPNPESSSERRIPPRTGGPTTAQTNTGSLSTPTSTSTPNRPTDTARWLGEAQRRVREAQRAEDERRSRGSVNPRTRPQTPTRPQNPAQTRQTQPDRTQPYQTQPRQPQPRAPTRPTLDYSPEARSLETRSLETRRTDTRSLETFGTEARSLETLGGEAAVTLTTAPPLSVQRLGGAKRARMALPELRFDERELAKGLIWHQILSPPLSQRRTRLSRPRP